MLEAAIKNVNRTRRHQWIDIFMQLTTFPTFANQVLILGYREREMPRPMHLSTDSEQWRRTMKICRCKYYQWCDLHGSTITTTAEEHSILSIIAWSLNVHQHSNDGAHQIGRRAERASQQCSHDAAANDVILHGSTITYYRGRAHHRMISMSTNIQMMVHIK